MNRTLVIGTCLGLCLANYAAAEQIKTRAKNSPIKLAVAQEEPVPESVRESIPVPVQGGIVESVRGARPSAFSYPAGLSGCADDLYARLGYYPPYCIPMTSDTTYDLAFACFIRGMYNDAIAFANHGLMIRQDARLYLLRGVCEMHVGQCRAAEATAEQYLNAIASKNVYGLTASLERVNGPMRVRFEQILKHITSS